MQTVIWWDNYPENIDIKMWGKVMPNEYAHSNGNEAIILWTLISKCDAMWCLINMHTVILMRHLSCEHWY